MDQMINFGIDLGTTNSAITKFIKGEVEVFKNPMETGQETLPSVVYYKKDKIIIGGRAKSYLERDVNNVFGTFKRKMGTTESFKVKSLNQSKTPIELSSELIKELKGFVHTGELVEAAVITIPASFDVVQSNATKEAGYLAGLSQVVLLQEPIAASLAYANKFKESDLSNGQWLVYDLGGGTFDVALIKIKDGEMKVVDHEGDNFLGGSDFDNLIVEKIIIPYLDDNYNFENLEQNLKSRSGKYNSLYYKLLYNAEQAKIVLSGRTSAEIELINFMDDDQNDVDDSIDITRSEFESLIKPFIDNTISMVKKILVRNSFKPSDIDFNLLVGGSTYIPYVRQRLEEVLQIPINCNIDPTTAVAIGAAYFAGTKEKRIEQKLQTQSEYLIKLKLAYQKTSQEDEEFLAGKVEGPIDGYFYQITREDKGYDSGRKELTSRFSEDLPLLRNSYNFFRFTVFDQYNNVVETDTELIGIAHGKYNVAGQPLPQDISLEIDVDPDIESSVNETKLDPFFEKNSVLPIKKSKTYPLNKTVEKGSDEKIIINVCEGPSTSIPQANQSIGYIQISGDKLNRNLLRGADIEISLEMSESRDLKVTVYIPMLDQQFTEVFNLSQRHLPVSKLKDDVESLSEKLESEISEAIDREDYEIADDLNEMKKEVDDLVLNSNMLSEDDVTDKKFQFEDIKRKLAQEIDKATRDKRISILKQKYFENKEWCKSIVESNGNDKDHELYHEIIDKEDIILKAITPIKLVEAIDDLVSLASSILWRTPEFLIARFNSLCERPQLFNDPDEANKYIESGKLAIANRDTDKLKESIFGLIDLLPKHAQQDERTGRIGFGG